MQLERSATSRGRRAAACARAVAALAVALVLAAAMPASAATLERIRETGRIRFGYLADARPFSYRSDAGDAEGYAVALCQRIAEQVKTQLALPDLTVDWVPVTVEDRLREVQQGNIDLLCAPTSADARPAAGSLVLDSGLRRAAIARWCAPMPRGAARRARRERSTHATGVARLARGQGAGKDHVRRLSGTTTETLARRAASRAFQIDARIVPVADYRTGLQQLLDRKVDVFFGDRTVVLGAHGSSATRKDLVILDRMFTHEPIALALARGDEDFRLLVDRALSQLYASSEFRELYTKWFGAFDDDTRTFFQWNTLAE